MTIDEQIKQLQYKLQMGLLTASQYNAEIAKLQPPPPPKPPEPETSDVVDEFVNEVVEEIHAVDEDDEEVEDATDFLEDNATRQRGGWNHAMAYARESTATAPVAPEDDFIAVSSPRTSTAAIRVARRWLGVPDKTKDSEAIKAGVISPEVLMLLMSIFNEVLQNCLSNNSRNAYQRLRGYCDEKNEMAKMADTIRLWWLTDRWMNRLGLPRDRGDVRVITQAIVEEASGITEAEFKELQMEVLFLTV